MDKPPNNNQNKKEAENKRDRQRERKRERQRERDRELRDDPEYRAAENERQRERYENDSQYRETRLERQRERRRKLRADDPEYRAAENARERERRRKLRADPEYRAAENERQRERRRELRANDPEYRAAENARNRKRYRERRAGTTRQDTQEQQPGPSHFPGSYMDNNPQQLLPQSMYNTAAEPSGYRTFNEDSANNSDFSQHQYQHQYWGQQPTTTFNTNYFGSDTDFSAAGPPETEYATSSGFNDASTDIGSSVSQHWEQPPLTADDLAQLTNWWITQGDTNPRPQTVTQRTEALQTAFENQGWNFTQHTNHPLPHQISHYSTLTGWNREPTAQPQPNTTQHTQQSQTPSTHQHNSPNATAGPSRTLAMASSNQQPSRIQRIAAAQQQAQQRQNRRQQERNHDEREQ
jgi:hypothetical protein